MTPLREILVVHHTHTDWGYTSHPTVVEQQHYRFIDEAVALCQQYPDYRWTCESAWVVQGYLRQRPSRAFRECVARGQIEVAGLPLHPTPLADAGTIRAALTILDELRAEGIPVSVAIGCDINGLSWPWADALLDAKIDGLGMAMNFVCGGGMKRWAVFDWQTPTGRKLRCWAGTHYNHGAYWGLNHDAYPTSEVAPQRIRELRRYPYEKLLLQVTNIPPDNMGPHPRYLAHLATYNRLADDNGWPRMRAATLREWFDFLKTKPAPTYTGDWTDWWASGIASMPRETAAILEAQRRTALAEHHGADGRDVRRKIFLAAEHTYGSSQTAKAPYSVATQAGTAAKANFAYEAAYAANELLRHSLRARYVMHDSQFESFDPAWRTMVKGDKPASLRSEMPAGESPDWNKLLGKTEVTLERATRADWFEVGKFNVPESHGRWPANPGWKRSRLPSAITREVSGDVARVNVQLRLEYSEDARGIYISFPFRLTGNVLADVGGAWADPRRENIPGSCHNWWTVHRGVLLTSAKGSVLWTSWDAPLTMFDAPCPNPPKQRNRLKPPVLIAWAYHNYWFTNFPVHVAGDLKFRFRIKYWPRRVTVAEAEEFCASDPLADYPEVAEIKA